MPAHTKLWYFERFGLIQALSEAQRRQFAGMARMFEVKRGSRIYLPGDPSDQIYLLKAGVIKIARQLPDQGDIILALLHPGDIFGELAVVDDAPRDHLAEAYEDSVICAMNRDTITRMIQAAPELGFQITKLIGRRLRTFESRIEELLCKSAHARVAHALLDLAARHGIADSDGVLIPLRLSQGDLARLVGLRRETVNGILQEWRERGLVEADRRAIRVRDVEGLRSAS
jgi:CRP-like cAMP-binding protein